MSLSETKTDAIVSVTKINSNPYRNRLMEMGFYPGAKIKIAKNSKIDPLVVIVGESRYSLNKELAHHIIVD
jgi:Fe2+ transport system protein FeoA